jgi:hypothetical protein
MDGALRLSLVPTTLKSLTPFVAQHHATTSVLEQTHSECDFLEAFSSEPSDTADRLRIGTDPV